jgi:hypothetical protein
LETIISIIALIVAIIALTIRRQDAKLKRRVDIIECHLSRLCYIENILKKAKKKNAEDE